jgi:predicted O-methyltransferase YrrM
MDNLFFKLHVDKKIKINKKKSNVTLKKDIFTNFELTLKKLKDSKILNNKFVDKIYKLDELQLDSTSYIFKIFEINYNNSILIRGEYINNEFIWEVLNSKLEKIYNIPGKYNKHDTIIQDMLKPSLYNFIKNMNDCERQIFLKSYYLEYISYFFDLLNDSGNVFISIFSFCDEYIVELMYILAAMFDYIIIYDTSYIYCSKFKGNNSLITKKDIEKIIKSENFTITPKNNLNELLKYIESSYKNKIENMELLLNNKYDDYIDKKIDYMYRYLKYIDIDKKTMNVFYKKIINILKRCFINNKITKIHSAIKELEGNYISKTISDNNYKKCLEIGMAFGISAFYILSNENTNLISIDPYQKTQWNNSGINLLKEFNFDNRHQCIYDKSYQALPDLLKKNGEEKYDFIFIDGWHTFDYTLIDFFYADKLLKVGGIIIIDDALHKGVEKTIKYISNNYKFYKKLESPITVGSYKKIKEDNRSWNYHTNF